jgi:hypothetical protein
MVSVEAFLTSSSRRANIARIPLEQKKKADESRQIQKYLYSCRVCCNKVHKPYERNCVVNKPTHHGKAAFLPCLQREVGDQGV